MLPLKSRNWPSRAVNSDDFAAVANRQELKARLIEGAAGTPAAVMATISRVKIPRTVRIRNLGVNIIIAPEPSRQEQLHLHQLLVAEPVDGCGLMAGNVNVISFSAFLSESVQA